MRNGSDSEPSNQIVHQGVASAADVLSTENSLAMALVDGAGLLASLKPATLTAVTDSFRPSNGRWIGIAALATVFVHNKSTPSDAELPKSLTDLTAPSWKTVGLYRHRALTSRLSPVRWSVAAVPMVWVFVGAFGNHERVFEASNYMVGSMPGAVAALAQVTLTMRLPSCQTAVTVLTAYLLMFLAACSSVVNLTSVGPERSRQRARAVGSQHQGRGKFVAEAQGDQRGTGRCRRRGQPHRDTPQRLRGGKPQAARSAFPLDDDRA